METSPENTTLEEGLRLIKCGQFDDAIGILGQLVEQNPEDPDLQGYLGIAYFQKGDKLHAIRHLEESVNIRETPRMYYNLGLVYEAAYREDEAIRQYKMALEIDPDYAPAQKALDKLHQAFEAAHPAPEPEEQTAQMQAQPSGGEAAGGTATAQAPPPPQPQRPTGPPDPLLLQIEKQKKVMEHQKALRKAGLSFGTVCGAIVMPALYFFVTFLLMMIGTAALAMLPKWAGQGAMLYVFLLMLIVIGAGFGAGVGLYVAKTCEGEGSGTKAGAALGFVAGLIFGLMSGAGSYAPVVAVLFCMFGAGAGRMIGRMVEGSIGWD